MRHEIKVEKTIRDSDGMTFVNVVMSDLAGADSFLVYCSGRDTKEALLALAHRLRLVSDDAADVAGMLFDREWVPEIKANSSSHFDEGPVLRVVGS